MTNFANKKMPKTLTLFRGACVYARLTIRSDTDPFDHIIENVIPKVKFGQLTRSVLTVFLNVNFGTVGL